MPRRVHQHPSLRQSTPGSERLALVSILGLIVVVCWAWLAVMVWDMSGSMHGPAAWMMTDDWDALHLATLWAMWAVMMAGMMLPSAGPLVALYVRIAHRQESHPSIALSAYGLVFGYLVAWVVFSVGATLLQRLLAESMLLSPMMEPAKPILAPVLLLVAGVYQMTPLKHSCLRSCQSPLMFFMKRWRPGLVGALRMGMRHGIYCLGCCWALMLLLFATGVMNLFAIVALTLWVMMEKLLPRGGLFAYVSGPMLIVTGLWMLFA